MMRYLDKLARPSETKPAGPRRPEAGVNLVRDPRGAVLLMGLFMGLSLAGSLWFILGIGDAIVLRDKAIEATDHAAFSAATVHARGMNYISALNLIMFALTIIYVGVCIVADIVINVGNLAGMSQYDGTTCGPNEIRLVPFELADVAEPACIVGHQIADRAVAYAGALSTLFKGMGTLEDVVQVGMPIAGEAAAMTIISQYRPYTGFAFTPAFIPIKEVSQSDGPEHFGMPLYGERDKYLCERTFLKAPGLPQRFNVPIVSHLAHLVIGMAEWYVMNLPPEDTWRGVGCHLGNPWSHTDVHLLNGGARRFGDKNTGANKVRNGEDVFQIYGFVVNAEQKEEHESERKISLTKNKGFLTEFQKPKKRIYFSQAEYYFDCTKDWKDVECYDNDERVASFSMAWRARLRRVYAPAFGGQLMSGVASRFATVGSTENFLYGLLGDMPIARRMTDAIARLRQGAVADPGPGVDLGAGLEDIAQIAAGTDKPYH